VYSSAWSLKIYEMQYIPINLRLDSRVDPEQKEELIGFLEKLLADKTTVRKLKSI